MSEACRALHRLVNARPIHRFPFDEQNIPLNGIYVLFEQGEQAHGVHRIVRIGTHTGADQLRSRLRQHFINERKDRSIFRKNLGRALLNRSGNAFLDHWNLDLTTRANRELYRGVVDLERQAEVERAVTDVIQSRFCFVVFDVPEKADRLAFERKMIGTVSGCSDCEPSSDWFGRYSPKPKIRQSGLWQEQELGKESLTVAEVDELASSLAARSG